MAKKVGRPTKYKEEYCDLVKEFVGEQGKTVCQLAFHLRVNESTIWQWAKVNEEFSNALRDAKGWSKAVWLDKLEKMMYERDVNSPLVKLYFASRFGMTEKEQKQESEDIESDGFEEQMKKATEGAFK